MCSYVDLPQHNNDVISIQRLASSSAELRHISNPPPVVSVIQTSSPLSTDAAIRDTVTRVDSVIAAAAPTGRRRTKLIAINGRRQTLSALPKVAKTVRFAPSPTRGVEYLIDESESVMPDRRPHLWTKEFTGELQTPDQLETESEEPFTPGLLRVYDFSAKELQQVCRSLPKFAEERTFLTKFFKIKLSGVPPLRLDALDREDVVADRSTLDIAMEEI
jgi:hypothetical protein